MAKHSSDVTRAGVHFDKGSTAPFRELCGRQGIRPDGRQRISSLSGIVDFKETIVSCDLEKLCSGQRIGNIEVEEIGVEPTRETITFFEGFAGFPWEADDKESMDLEAMAAADPDSFEGFFSASAFFHFVEHHLRAVFETEGHDPTASSAEPLGAFVVDGIDAGIASPMDVPTALDDGSAQIDHPSLVKRKGVAVEEEISETELFDTHLDFAHDMIDTSFPNTVFEHRARGAENAFGRAAALGIDGTDAPAVFGAPIEVELHEIVSRKRKLIEGFDERPRRIAMDRGISGAPDEASNGFHRRVLDQLDENLFGFTVDDGINLGIVSQDLVRKVSDGFAFRDDSNGRVEVAGKGRSFHVVMNRMDGGGEEDEIGAECFEIVEKLTARGAHRGVIAEHNFGAALPGQGGQNAKLDRRKDDANRLVFDL